MENRAQAEAKKGPHKHNDIHYKIIIRRKQQRTFFIHIALYLLA